MPASGEDGTPHVDDVPLSVTARHRTPRTGDHRRGSSAILDAYRLRHTTSQKLTDALTTKALAEL